MGKYGPDRRSPAGEVEKCPFCQDKVRKQLCIFGTFLMEDYLHWGLSKAGNVVHIRPIHSCEGYNKFLNKVGTDQGHKIDLDGNFILSTDKR